MVLEMLPDLRRTVAREDRLVGVRMKSDTPERWMHSAVARNCGEEDVVTKLAHMCETASDSGQIVRHIKPNVLPQLDVPDSASAGFPQNIQRLVLRRRVDYNV